MKARTRHPLSMRSVFGEMLTVYRRHWAFLITTAIVVLLPQVIADAVLDGQRVEGFESSDDVFLLGGVLLTTAVNLLGQAFYAGITAAAVVNWRAGLPLPRVLDLLGALPVGGLIVLDLVLTLGTAIGAVLLVIPALVFMTYVGISPAVLKLEHLGPRAALARSVDLVRGQAWRVFKTVVGVVVLSELAIQAITFPAHGLGTVVLVDLAADALLQPVEGLAIVVVAIRLLELHGEAPAPAALANALVERGAG